MDYVKGLLSICCTCYNHAEYIEECINSIWNNDYKNVEIIVIDDGSKDNSVEVLKKLQSISPCRFEIISQENTHNIGLNLNRAILKAHGEFITFMSCDDYYTKDAFSNKLNIMNQDNNIVLTISRRVLLKTCGDENITLEDPIGQRFNSKTSIEDLCEIEYKEGTFAVQGNIFRNEIIDKVGRFDEDIWGDDIVIRTKVLQYMKKNPKLSFRVIESPSFYYRRHSSNYSSNLGTILNILLDTYDRYWAERPYSPYVENAIFTHMTNSDFNVFYPLFLKHPKTLKLIYNEPLYMKHFLFKLNKFYKTEDALSFIFKKEDLNIYTTRYTLFKFIKITKTKAGIKMPNEYDLVCSLGGNCTAAHNLLERDMRYFSLPFDWCYIVDEKPIYKLAECFKNNSLCEIAKKENLVPLTEEEEKEVNHPDTLHYKDNYSGYYFVNHFHKKLNEGGYEPFREKFERRIKRLSDCIERSDKILFILGTQFQLNIAPVLELQKILNDKYPKKKIVFEVVEFKCEEDKIFNENENLTVRKYMRDVNLYDFTKTNFEWSFLDEIKLSDLFNTNKSKKKKIPLYKKMILRLIPIKEFRHKLREFYEI